MRRRVGVGGGTRRQRRRSNIVAGPARGEVLKAFDVLQVSRSLANARPEHFDHLHHRYGSLNTPSCAFNASPKTWSSGLAKRNPTAGSAPDENVW